MRLYSQKVTYRTILLHKAVRIYCLYLKILIPTERIKFSILDKPDICPGMDLGYSILVFKSWEGIKVFLPFPTTMNTELQIAWGAAASMQ